MTRNGGAASGLFFRSCLSWGVIFGSLTDGAVIVSVLALGELIGDKLPMTPSRLSAAPLGGRAITSSLAAAAVALGLGQSWVLGVMGAAIGSLGGAFAGFHVRHELVRRLGLADWIVAVVEDLVTIGLVLLVLAFLF